MCDTYFKRNMLLEGISLVRLVTQKHRRPEVVHDRKVLWPIKVGENRAQQRINFHFVIKSVHQQLDVPAICDVLHTANLDPSASAEKI